ncbi:MAG: hypothetical protein H8F28_05315 [Fibrella sp.]|nr:hypothetical protein [Armatimonadota bacterium]
MALNNDQTQEFCNGFFAYGNPSDPFWFIGIEEGGGKSESEIAARLDA